MRRIECQERWRSVWRASLGRGGKANVLSLCGGLAFDSALRNCKGLSCVNPVSQYVDSMSSQLSLSDRRRGYLRTLLPTGERCTRPKG